MDRIAEHVGTVLVEIAGHCREVNPSPDEREGDGCSKEAAPHDQPVRQPTQPASPEDEPVRGELKRETTNELEQVAAEEPSREEHPPAPPPIHPRRRPLQPHRVTVRNPERRK